MTYWAELIELYEYRVADLLAGRKPRVAQRSMNELRRTLLAADLSLSLRRRLREADQNYRAWKRQQTGEDAAPRPRSEAQAGPALQAEQQRVGHAAVAVAGSEQVAGGQGADGQANRPEHHPAKEASQQQISQQQIRRAATTEAWYELQVMAWHHATSAELSRQLLQLRHEPQRPTLRVLYAVTENAERQLRGINELLSVPSAHDRLITLRDKDVVRGLIESLSDLLLHPLGRQAVLASLNQVRDQPFFPHPDDEHLRHELEAVQHQAGQSTQARELLMDKIRQKYPQAHDPRERPDLRAATLRLSQRIEAQLARLPAPDPSARVVFAPVVGQAGPDLPGSGLPGSGVAAPDEQATEVTVYLGAREPDGSLKPDAPPVQQLRWRGHQIRWQATGRNWQLQLDKALVMLYPHLSARERVVMLKEGPVTWEVYYNSAYVLLRLQTTDHAELARLATEARAIAVLINPAEDYACLRLARAAAQALRGRPLNLPALSAESAQSFAHSAPEDLQQFVQKGLATLKGHIHQRLGAEVQATLEQCAQAIGVSRSYAQQLQQVLGLEVGTELGGGPGTGASEVLLTPETMPTAGPDRTLQVLRTDGVFQALSLKHLPLELLLLGRRLTLRQDFRGELTLLIPGMAPHVIHDLRVLELGELTLMLARHEHLLAVAAQPRN